MRWTTNGPFSYPPAEQILAITDPLDEGDVSFQFMISHNTDTALIDLKLIDFEEQDKHKLRICVEAFNPVISPIMTMAVLAGEKLMLILPLETLSEIQGALIYGAAVPPPNLDPEATKVVVGAAVNCLGIADEVSGEISTKVTFNVNLSQSGSTYWTQACVTITPADTQKSIRAKTIAAVKQQILDEFGLTVNDYDVILSNYWIGT
jgi:hypothetical protein